MPSIVPDEVTFEVFDVVASTTGPFNFGFQHTGKPSLRVTVDNVSVDFNLTPGSVVDAAGYDGGSFSLLVAAANARVVIYRLTTVERDANLSGANLTFSGLNGLLNEFAYTLQELRRDIARALLANFGESGGTVDPEDIAAVAAIASAVAITAGIDAEILIAAGLAVEIAAVAALDPADLAAIAAGLAGKQDASATLTGMAAPTYAAGDFVEATAATAFRGRKLVVATYAALTAIPAANRFDGMAVLVMSRSGNDDDGTHGWWHFDAASATAANGGTILAPDSGTGRWFKKLKTSISPIEFGAVGDGSTNDYAALQAALTASAGRKLNLRGLVYRCDTALIGASNTHVINGTLDFSQGLASGGIGILFAGALGSADTSLSAVAYTDRTLTVANNTGYAAGNDLIVRSTDIWAAADSSVRGQWVRVKSLSGGTVLNLYGSSYDAYTTSRSLYKPTLVENIRFKDVTFIGRGDTYNGKGVRFQYAKNVRLENCTFRHWAYAGAEFYTSRDVRVVGCNFAHGEDVLGASYGVALYDGCERVRVTDCDGEDLRHLFTAGGTLGVNRFVTVKGCTGVSMTESFLDAHPSCEFITFIGNVGEHETAFDGDGIVYQGANGIISGNQVVSSNQNGILIQPCAYHNRDSMVITGNAVNRVESASGIGILIDILSPLRSLVINGNSIESPVDRGIVITTSGFNLSNTTITGNSVDGSVAEALYMIANGTDVISRTAISGNAFRRANQSGPVIDCFAGTEGFNNKIAVTGNTIEGGTYGVRCDAECERVLIATNIIQGFLTAATLLTGVAISTVADNVTT